MAGALALATVPSMGWAVAAHADSSSGSGAQIIGYNVTAQGIGAQFGFNIPNLIPLPNENIIEADTPFARTIISSGQTFDAVGAGYYPGDILGNFGGLASEFLPPQFPNPGNWPFMARAQYPKNPTYPGDSTFGVNPPAGSPVAPSAFSGLAHTDANGGHSTGTLANLVVGPGLAPGGADILQVGTLQSTSAVTIGASQVASEAHSIVRAISIAGMIDIASITSDASSTSDGTTGTPVAALHLGQVTVAGQQAYIDATGIHLAGNGAPGGIPTPAQVQQTLNATLAQDGISIRLLDPQQTTNGAEGIANSGGLVITIDHAFSVPFVNTGALSGGQVQPCINTDTIIPNQNIIGKICLPAGNYEAITSITLGLSSVDNNANALTAISVPGGSGSDLGSLGGGGNDLTLPSLASGTVTSPGTLSGPGVATAPGGGTGINLLKFPIRGVPAPFGWVVFGILLCVIFAYPLMLAARWQFLVGRR
ncbi:MAG: hypothetical protein ACYDA2_00855 [Acidimicrobiales bacterium]